MKIRDNRQSLSDNRQTKKQTCQGLSTLVLVFVIAALMALLILSLQLNTALSARRATQVQNSQTAFFAAEGAMYETLQHLNNDPSWPDPDSLSPPMVDVYFIGETQIRRTISLDNGQIVTDITATIEGVKRRLIADYSRGEEEIINPTLLDVMLVIDHSLSMGQVADDISLYPLDYAKEAALEFIDYIDNNGSGDDRIGVANYSDDGQLSQNLTTNFEPVREAINNLSASGYTNIGAGVHEGRIELKNNSREEAVKVMVILSDGVANKSYNDVCGPPCLTWPCFNDNGSSFAPDNGGTCCTNNAIDEANLTKSDTEAAIFSVLLNNIPAHQACLELLGRLTLLRASSEPAGTPLPPDPLPPGWVPYTYYKETTEWGELGGLYQEIAETITTSDFFEIREELPEPEEEVL